MPKLITPVQFEPSLDGLNIVRPLLMPDECKTVISYPVLCQNLPSEGRPGVGKMSRCTQSGALLRDDDILGCGIFATFPILDEEGVPINKIFDRKVIGINAILYAEAAGATAYWCSPDGVEKYVEINQVDVVFLPFVGKSIWFVSDNMAMEETYLRLFCIYE